MEMFTFKATADGFELSVTFGFDQGDTANSETVTVRSQKNENLQDLVNRMRGHLTEWQQQQFSAHITGLLA